MITLDRVTYTYPRAARPVITNLSLGIAPGEFVVVCGPSGAGKSTFLRLLNGLVPHFYGGAFAGDVQVWGRSTRTHQPRDLADRVGFVFQDPESQFVVDVVEDELVFAMENLGLPQQLMRRRVEEVLDQLAIAHLRRRRVSTLSGGEQQRVAIAAVLAAQPLALVLDEPTSQIDPHGAEEVLTALQKLNDDLGLTIVLSEHRLERVVQYADRLIAFERDGSVISGPPRDILARTELAPPLARLGRSLGWEPLPLTIKEGRRHAATLTAPPAPPAPMPPTSAPAIDVARVHVTYGDHEALYDVSLRIYPGEVLALMGRNGSGKTTLLKLIAGLVRQQQGSVQVLGHIISRQDTETTARFVGYVPQNPRSLLYHDTVREELAFTLRAHGITNGTASQNIASTLERLGIAHLAEAYPRDLSGGEAQRAALAAITVADQPVLLLDEPTRGLDYSAKTRLGMLIRDLAARGRALIIATHDVELAAAFADRVALLGDGELVVEGPSRDVLSDSLLFSPQIAKLFPRSGWLTAEDVLR